LLFGPHARFTGKVGRRPSGVLGTTQGERLTGEANVKDSHSSHRRNFVHHNVAVWAHDDEAVEGCVDEVARDIGRDGDVGCGGVGGGGEGVAMRTEQGFDGVAELVE